MDKKYVIYIEAIFAIIFGIIATYIGMIEQNLLGSLFLLAVTISAILLFDGIFDIKWIKTPDGVKYI